MNLANAIQNRLGAQGYDNTTERRLAIQGYAAGGNPEIERALLWARAPYVLCAVTTGIATSLAFPAMLWALMPLAVLGAVLPYNPLDYLYNLGIRRFTGTGKIPSQGSPRRFACGLPAAWLASTALAFQFGLAPVGYALGAALVATAAFVSATHICIPSMTYALIFGGQPACDVSFRS